MRTTRLKNRWKQVKVGDRISHLPDALLTYILSFLFTKESVRTSVLSTKWKLLWASVPALHLSFEEFGPEGNQYDPLVYVARNTNFSNFVNRFLLQNCLPYIGKIYLSGWGPCPVESWINAVKDHVQEMELDIYLEEEGDPRIKFPASLFLCRMLVVLKLQLSVALDIPMGAVCFPHLKVLELKWIEFKEDTSAQNLISSCPVLEDLNIERHEFGPLLLPQQFIVASKNLKRLTLHFFHYYKYLLGSVTNARIMTVIDTPALQFLDILDEFSSEFVVGEMGSVSEAKLDLRGRISNMFTDESLFAKCSFKLLRAIYNTKYLSLSDFTMVSLMVADCYEFPTFNNLTHLDITFVDYEEPVSLEFLTEFVNSSPNMELLNYESYEIHVKEADWKSHPDVASYFLSACDSD